MSTAIIVSILIVFLVAILCLYLVDAAGIGQPANKIAKLIIIIIAILSLLKYVPGIL